MDDSNYELGWQQVRNISLDLSNYQPANNGQANVKTDMVRLINNLFSARRARLLAARAHLPDAVWQIDVYKRQVVMRSTSARACASVSRTMA